GCWNSRQNPARALQPLRVNTPFTQLANPASISLRYRWWGPGVNPLPGVTVLAAIKMNSDNSASLNARTVIRGGPIRWLILGGMLLIAGIAVGATVMAGNFRERALSNAERELENTVVPLARHFDQQLEDFEVIQSDVIQHMQANGIS